MLVDYVVYLSLSISPRSLLYVYHHWTSPVLTSRKLEPHHKKSEVVRQRVCQPLVISPSPVYWNLVIKNRTIPFEINNTSKEIKRKENCMTMTGVSTGPRNFTVSNGTRERYDGGVRRKCPSRDPGLGPRDS